jgi:hypothetical protein
MSQLEQRLLVGLLFLAIALFSLRQFLFNIKEPRADWCCRIAYSLMGLGSWEHWVMRWRATYLGGVIVGAIGAFGFFWTA